MKTNIIIMIAAATLSTACAAPQPQAKCPPTEVISWNGKHYSTSLDQFSVGVTGNVNEDPAKLKLELPK